MKKYLILLLVVSPLFLKGQEIVTTDENYFMMIRSRIGFMVKSVIYPEMASIECDSVHNEDSIVHVFVRVDQDSLGKFHNVSIGIVCECLATKEYLENKKKEIINEIEKMRPIMVFYHEDDPYVYKNGISKEELFQRRKFLNYGFHFRVQNCKCEGVLD